MQMKMSNKGKKNKENKINVLKLEMDYQLMCLHDAMKTGDVSVQEVSKRKLETIGRSLSELGYFK